MLNIGWAKKSIAPDYPVVINGQMHRRVSMGQATPVLASALVLENAGDSVIFVSCDMVSVPAEILLKVQEILQAEIPEIPVEKIIINATHTHAGPSYKPYTDFPCEIELKQGDEVLNFISGQIAAAVKEAWQTRAQGSIAYGYGFAVTGHSRRATYLDDYGKRTASNPGLMVDGHAKMYGPTSDDMFAGYENGMDAFINLLYTFDKDNKLTGAIINVPCPSQTGEGAWVFHASFWHNVREKLTAKYGDIGVVAQCAAAGDLSPRQLHYKAAEIRRYKLKYPEEIANSIKTPYANPERKPGDPGLQPESNEIVERMRAEDIANRITAAFDEVLSWAEKEKFADPVIEHRVVRTGLAARMFPAEIAAEEEKNYNDLIAKEFKTGGDPYADMYFNSRLMSARNRCKGVMDRFKNQQTKKTISTSIHAVRIGDIAFTTNRFELYMSYMHRIQGRSPFLQTFIIQLVTDQDGTGSYLATQLGEDNKGYSASPYCNQVSPEGGQQLVEETLELLKDMHK